MTDQVALCHGFWKNQLAFGLPYWNDDGLPAVLKERKFEVHYPHVEWFGKLDERAGQLSVAIKRIANEAKKPVHVIGHSMGGLDIRRALGVDVSLREHVASVHTIATPHWGSAVADYFDAERIDNVINRMFHMVGIPFEGLDDLTFDAARQRNREMLATEIELASKIPYRFFGGAQKPDDIFWPMIFTWRLGVKAPRALTVEVGPGHPDYPKGEGTGKKKIQIRYYPSGQNDGMVSTDSSMFTDSHFGEAEGTLWNFDHLNFTGYWDPAEVDAFGRDEDPKHDSRWIGEFEEHYRHFAETIADGLAV